MPAAAEPSGSLAGPLLASLRVHQWVKNLVVLAPLVFSRRLFHDADAVLSALAALGLFCLASAAVYLLNDVLDAEADRAHPVKCRRPVASGALPARVALTASGALAACSLLVGLLVDPRLAAVLAAYLTLQVLYSKFLKRLAFMDVLAIAVGFVLRVEAGGIVISVVVSRWLVLCTLLLACYLGLGKRKHEMASAHAAASRGVLTRYSPRLLRALQLATGVATIGAYGLYTLQPRTAAFFGTEHLPWTLPFVVFGVVRFAQLVGRPHGDSPTEEMLRDWPFVLNVVGWAALVLWLIR